MPRSQVRLSMTRPAVALDRHGEDIVDLVARFVDTDARRLESRLLRARRVILYWSGPALVGLTALRVEDVLHECVRVRVLYTHDVMLDRGARGQGALERAAMASYLRFGVPHARRRIYWFADLCTLRSYRILTRTLGEAWPVAGREMPAFERGLYEHLCEALCGASFDPATGTTRPLGELHREPEGIPTERIASDPHAAFFVSRNPGYLDGNGLPGLARLRLSSMLGVARMGRPGWPTITARPCRGSG